MSLFVCFVRFKNGSINSNGKYYNLVAEFSCVRIDVVFFGIMGFSAGGHLASTLGTHYDELGSDIEFKSINARLDFMILVYPVISFKQPYVHEGSKNFLIGDDTELINFYSNELHVDENTPPTFLVHSGDDQSVPAMNSIIFYEALQKENIYSEMHIYPTGRHGYALAIDRGHLSSWPDRLID